MKLIWSIALIAMETTAYEDNHHLLRSKEQGRDLQEVRMFSVSSSSPTVMPKSGKSKTGKPKSAKKTSDCQVAVTNLSYRQAFGEMFVMLHDQEVTNDSPIYEFGQSPTEQLCNLTQNLDARGLQTLYSNKPGVHSVAVTSNFTNIQGAPNADFKYLRGGATFTFSVPLDSEYISIAAGLPFTNDGGFVLQAAPVVDGGEHYLPAIDSGCEANLQTCWSVPASQEDFQILSPRAQCADDDVSDANDNDVSGENFVSIHRGLQDLDSKDEIETLSLLECNDMEGISDDDNQGFAKYFRTEGYKDSILLCSVVDSNGVCSLRNNTEFIDFINNNNNNFDGNGSKLINMARGSSDFDDFCDKISDFNKDLESAFKILEPILFDFRNPIARVSIKCL